MLIDQIQYFIKVFGPEHKRLIEDSLTWLDEKEPTWNLPSRMNRYNFLKILIKDSKK